MTTVIPYREMSATIAIEKPKPLPGHLAPLDKRHRWLYVKTADWRGRGEAFRYRCSVCKKWANVTPLATLIARRMRDAAHRMEEHLSETLWRRS